MDALELVNSCEKELEDKFKEVDRLEFLNSKRVLDAFKDNGVSEVHFNGTTGYGFNDLGREITEKVFSDVLGAEDALVRCQIVSGSHALNVTLFALLRPGDLLVSITGEPYDALHEVIGLIDNPSSLKSFGVKYDQIELINNDFDYEGIKEYLKNNKVKVIEIQRSRGYSTRSSLTIDKVEKVIKEIRSVDKDVIIMIDNCYCEFVEEKTPLEVGADIIVGSLIKNLGGGLAPNGGYIAGKSNLVNLAGERLTLPGEGRDVGPTLGANRTFLQGLFNAPSVVASSLKTSLLTACVLEKLGYEVEPKVNDKRADIVQTIILRDRDKLIRYCELMQSSSPIDSNVRPIPSEISGYASEIIMAAGCFVQGSTIELSCDGPLREPYIAYQQGGLTYQYGKLAIVNIVTELMSDKNENK